MLVVSSTPAPRVGTVDLSVAVQPPDSGGDTQVRIVTIPADGSAPPREYEVVREAGNPDRYHVSVAFPTAGSWFLTVRVSGSAGTHEAHLGVEVSRMFMGATPDELAEFSLPVIALLAVLLLRRVKRDPKDASEEGLPPRPFQDKE